jgi:Zn finger protein HypA/HybF involved in hydrogenase expression
MPQEWRYECPTCGAKDVRLCFPVWVPANDLEDRSRWNLDEGASPEKDSDKGWCPVCDDRSRQVRGGFRRWEVRARASAPSSALGAP